MVVDWLSYWDILRVELWVSSWIHFNDDTSVLGVRSVGLGDSLNLEALGDVDLLSGLLLWEWDSDDDGLLLGLGSAELLLLEGIELLISELNVSDLLALVGDGDDLGDLGGGLIVERWSSLFSAFFAGEDDYSDEEKDEDGSLESSLSELLSEMSHVFLSSEMFVFFFVIFLGVLNVLVLFGGALGGGGGVLILVFRERSMVVFVSLNSVLSFWLGALEELVRSFDSLRRLFMSLLPSVSAFEDLSGYFLSIEFGLIVVLVSSPLAVFSTVFSAEFSTVSLSSMSSSLFSLRSRVILFKGSFRGLESFNLLRFFLTLEGWELIGVLFDLVTDLISVVDEGFKLFSLFWSLVFDFDFSLFELLLDLLLKGFWNEVFDFSVSQDKLIFESLEIGWDINFHRSVILAVNQCY